MDTRHDLRRPNCQKAEPQKFVSHSNGTVFYLCKNCNYLGTINAFTKTLAGVELFVDGGMAQI